MIYHQIEILLYLVKIDLISHHNIKNTRLQLFSNKNSFYLLNIMGNFFCRRAEKTSVVKADYSNNFFEKTDSILKTTDLTDNQKILFKRRYMNKLHSFRNF